MFKITTELGEFEGETEKEARTALRKAQRLDKANRAEQSIRRDVAYRKAKADGYDVLRCLVEKLTGVDTGNAHFPRSWTFYGVGAKWSENLFRPTDKRDYDGHVKVTRFSLEGGDAEIDHYGWDVVGAVCRGNGYVLCLFLMERSTGDVQGFTAALEGDQWVTLPVPGITPQHFRQSTETM
jgi:hypothetical protein